ncbi:MAG: nitronate monooxygenase family protein [Lachnospiraceae bacterium]|nr:nitronate monooxygenase family protein [Lachnospiraceae bacterium]
MNNKKYSTLLPKLHIGDLTAKLPIIQGGMGIGVSRSSLAGAVAREGGVGIISTAQIGYDEEGFEQDQAGCNLLAIRKHIQRAKELSQGNGLVGVNIMVALKHFEEHVKEAVAAGADVIISGAGLPLTLPALVGENCHTKIAPIVSSVRAASVILKKWAAKYNRTADFLVVEGPKAGGHLGFSREQLSDLPALNYDEEIKGIIQCKKEYEEKFNKKIPVIVAGGIFDRGDIDHVLSLGADGVQMASRFVATEECDASEAYKMAYVNARAEDIQIVQSPVGMPGRALKNTFIEKTKEGSQKITKCYNCLQKCNPAAIPYCITKALVDAVKGDVDNGLMFCGSNTDRIDRIVTVHELMQELAFGV